MNGPNLADYEALKTDWRAASDKPMPGAVCLRLADWLTRDIPPPEYLLGQWLATTSRVILNAPTGLGKTNFTMALGFAIAAGAPFLHWSCPKPARVLIVDGEMSRRLLRTRLADAATRCGSEPENLFALCRDDTDGMPPLNTTDGQEFIDRTIEQIGGVDLAIFDNVMSLIPGEMKEEEGWAQTLPWIRSLTTRSIGQLWVHHTGHDKSRGYGTSTREWQLDTSILLEAIERPDADIAFSLKFKKARERTPDNRTDFEDADITLADNQWQSSRAAPPVQGKPPSPKGQKFFAALGDALVAAPISRPEPRNRVATTLDAWKLECARLGLLEIDLTTKQLGHTQRSLFSKYRLELIAANWIACNGEFVWSVRSC